MTEHNDQLTWQQVLGMLLLGACVWAVLIGIGYAIVATNGFPGLVIAVAGIIGSYILIQWLTLINKPEE